MYINRTDNFLSIIILPKTQYKTQNNEYLGNIEVFWPGNII